MQKRTGWVTFAMDERGMRNGLILLRSLRQVFTAADVVLIVPPNFPGHLWSHIASTFDQVLVLPQTAGFGCKRLGEGGTCSSNCAAIAYASWLTQYEKLLFLDNDSLILENVDDMLEGDQHLMVLGIRGCIEPVLKTVTPSLKISPSCACDEPVQTPRNYIRLNEETQLDMLEENPKIVQGLEYLRGLRMTKKKGERGSQLFQGLGELVARIDKEVNDFLGDAMYRQLLLGFRNEPIAVVGMACRLPGCNSVQEYWSKLKEGASLMSEVPLDRPWWPRDTADVRGGFLSCSISTFDAPFFSMSPREAEFTDPQQRLQMELLWEGLEDAGINPNSLFGSNTGIYTSSWTSDYDGLLVKEGVAEEEPFRRYIGNGLGGCVAKMGHLLGVNGPTVGIESACSSSAQTVWMGMTDLRNRRTDLALVSGANLVLAPFTATSFNNILARDYVSKVFDVGADGFVRAEGVGTLVLKRLSDAVKDGDRIHVLLRGFGTSQEGESNSVGTPTVGGQALAMRRALADAGVNPEDVQVIEAHATGTALGDPLEIRAIREVYSTPIRKGPLVITAGKCSTGHPESFSGIAGIIKTILQMAHGVIPPQVNVSQLNPNIEIESIPAEISVGSWKAWEGHGTQARIAGISSFGITGTNTHVILQEPPKQLIPVHHKASPPLQVLTLSAQCPEALSELVEKYKTYFRSIDGNGSISLDSIASTANIGRAHFPHRIALVGSSVSELLAKLENMKYHIGAAVRPLVTFLYPGQGSIFHGMGKGLYGAFPVFKQSFDACAQVLREQHRVDLKKAIWGSTSKTIHTSIISTFLIFVMEHCLTKLWSSWGVRPSAVLGHCLGEIAAAESAGLISLKDAFSLLNRGPLVEALPKGKMVVVRQDEKAAMSSIGTFLVNRKNKGKHWLDIAAVNSPSQTVISGPPQTVDKFTEFAKNNGISVHVLDTTHAFHSRGLEPILAPYREITKTLLYATQEEEKVRFISSVDGAVHTKLCPDYWVSNLRDKVDFIDASKTMFAIRNEANSNIFLEVGGHPILSPLLIENSEDNDKVKCFPSMRKPHPTKSTYDEVGTLLDTLCRLYAEGVPVDWEGFHALHPREKVTLPSYPFQRKPYWVSTKAATTSLHALLGRKVNLPCGGEESHFQNFDLKLKTLPSYMRDHQTLFPAAGFFELFLAASAVHEEGTGFPLSLEDAYIPRALLLEDVEEGVSLHTQLSLSDEDDGKMKIQVFSRKEGTDAKWILHAKALVHKGFKAQGSIVDETELKSLRDLAFEEKGSTSNLYLSMKSAGYNFGPSFQSVRRTWRGPSSSFLSEIRFPLIHHNEEDLLPPIVLDGMLQSFLISQIEDVIKDNKILLPVGFRRFTLLCRWKPERDSKMMKEAVFYVHIPSTVVEAQAAVIVLYSEEGTPLSVMEGMLFLPTSTSALERILRHGDLNGMPLIPLYSEDWIADANHGSGRAAFRSQIDLADVQLAMEHMNTVVDTEVEGEDDRFIGLAILETFMELGALDRTWCFDLDHFVNEFDIRPDLTLTVRRLMDILVEDGFACWSTPGPAFSLHPGLPSLAEIRGEMSRMVGKVVSYDFSATQFFCSKLPCFLLGEELIQDTLFADNKYSAKSLSSHLFREQVVQEGMTSVIRLLLSEANYDGEGVLRILEIGSATSGAATRTILDLLTQMCVKFEYDYATTSDDSVEAEVGLSLNYRVLDIQSDPKPQGFLSHKVLPTTIW